MISQSGEVVASPLHTVGWVATTPLLSESVPLGVTQKHVAGDGGPQWHRLEVTVCSSAIAILALTAADPGGCGAA